MNPAATRALTGFEPLTGGHALSAELGALLDRVAADALLRGDGAPPGARVAIRRQLRADPEAGRIARFTWCAQWRDPGPEARFRARTLLYERGRGEPRVYDFPDDPWLPGAGAPDGPLAAPGVEVLRYIPVRRITFRRGDRLVGKVKRRKSAARSYARLQAVSAAARGAAFAVPEPRGLDAPRGAFYQDRMPGRPVDELIDAANAGGLLRALGALHRAVHELRVEGIPAADPGELVAAVRADAAWVAFAVPGQAAAVAGVERRLVAELEALGAGQRAFCHGDLALDQVLLDGDAFAVVDFDDAALGDPYADLATLIAGLPLDAPQLFAAPGPLRERAIAAYLDGYRERSGRRVDEPRLRAHRARAELALLASQLEKGLAGEADVAAAVDRLRAT
jgi:aminoglycoside phosphotransferase (APT) family kinase protein